MKIKCPKCNDDTCHNIKESSFKKQDRLFITCTTCNKTTIWDISMYHKEFAKTLEWATPKKDFEAIQRFLGVKFTLDVSATKTNTKCKYYFTELDNGLCKDWRGYVWCNPPYGGTSNKEWSQKAIEQKENCEMIALLMSAYATETVWFRNLAANSIRVLFLNKRINFENPFKQDANGAKFGNALFILAPEKDKQEHIFSHDYPITRYDVDIHNTTMSIVNLQIQWSSNTGKIEDLEEIERLKSIIRKLQRCGNCKNWIPYRKFQGYNSKMCGQMFCNNGKYDPKTCMISWEGYSGENCETWVFEYE